MRACFIAFLIVLTGCATTQGSLDREMDSTDPYVFTFDGDAHAAHIALKRMLVQNSFEITEEDADAGILVGLKLLGADEHIRLTVFGEAMASSMAGVSVGEQYGSLTFLFTETDTALVITMQPRYNADVTTARNAFRQTEQAHAGPMIQGHPLPVKYGYVIREMDGWELVSPSQLPKRR